MKVEVETNVSQVVGSLQRFSDGLLASLAGTLDDQNLFTLGKIQRDQLNFPRKGPTQPHGLRHQSGKLFSSPISTPAKVIGEALESVIGSAVVYAAVHEYGSTKKNIPARAPFQTGLHARVPEYLTAIQGAITDLWATA